MPYRGCTFVAVLLHALTVELHGLQFTLSDVAVSEATSKIRDVYIFAGQSNCNGLAQVQHPAEYAKLLASYATPPDEMRQWTHHWESWTHGATVGPELSFGHHMQKSRHGHKPFGVVKICRPATSIYTDWSLSQWKSLAEKGDFLWLSSVDSNGLSNSTATIGSSDELGNVRLFPLLVNETRSALSANECESGRCRAKAFIWMQGEADSYNTSDADKYEDALTKLVGTIREALETPNLRVVISGLHPDTALKRGEAGPRLLQAQKHFVHKDRNAAFVPTDEIGKMEDDLHYNADGLLKLGHRLASAAGAI